MLRREFLHIRLADAVICGCGAISNSLRNGSVCYACGGPSAGTVALDHLIYRKPAPKLVPVRHLEFSGRVV